MFGVYDPNTKEVVGLRQQDLYKEDWIGLKELDESGKLRLDVLEGEHMQIDWDFFNQTIVHGVLS